ncbi:transketolase [Megasphaera cerevisiae DSM 20462]|uniref:Transketolase n=1 Tax=Megasphaera cerevisiae DSM 20462 TaxID=1122219 RepID=A0A0J6WWW2_9FIRM|nr:transketolase [Megasphaera cerevisiae]KMO86708.1 transketolase [Megasphaera cerevisiae DSM 20462]OKY53305.1 transketolase [Megasphaera cerevisiae]SJZ86085.1 transketolase [Megasphaera cerevisiae DSM 20462]
MSTIDTTCVNAIRVLSADAIEKANSGHPGLPLGAAPAAYELWAHHMKHNATDPKWANRDRFILSGGHGSMLLYSLLHLYGYGLTMDDIKQFRQYGSLTPGHPEYGHTTGVEATTGPLGAGMSMAVGMAMAEAHLAALFNKPGYPIVDHYTFALGGDGCMMEGISSEAFSLAGTLGLSKLVILYDSNKISIEGSTDLAFTENVQKRMEAFGFQTITVEDGNDLSAIGSAIEEAKADTQRPSFITIKTQIGYGCPAKQGKASAHGSPLGAENIIAMKENLGWPKPTESFYIPEEVYAHYGELSKQAGAAEAAWQELLAAYTAAYPELGEQWLAFHRDVDADALLHNEEFWSYADKPQATRNLSGIMINRLKNLMPQLMGGSADLAPSNKTQMDGEASFCKDDYSGRNIHFGVRELAMTGVTNGLALHGGIRPYAGTFFVFSDYMKPMIRLAALMKLPVTYVLTHDSIGVGEDGPTHEPIEQLAMLRAVPNLNVFRPADAKETAAGWYLAVTSKTTPTALVLTRQNLPQLSGTGRNALKGAYIVSESGQDVPDAILIASGSEVSLSIEAKVLLEKEGIHVRVVSMPCMELFEKQSDDYKEHVLPRSVRARVAVEAASGFGWGAYVGIDGATVTMPGFGASGSAGMLFKNFGFTAEHVVETVKKVTAEV